MRGIRWAAGLAALLLGGASASWCETIKVVAWNLEWFPGWIPNPPPEQEALHMKYAQEALRSIQPDVLILSEVRNEAAVRELIQMTTGLQVNAITRFEGRPQQVAIASRFPMQRGGAVPWLRVLAGPPRGFVFAELALPRKKLLRVYGLHLKSNRGVAPFNETFRETSAYQLLHFMRLVDREGPRKRAAADVVGGDFNTSLDERRFAGDDTIRYLVGSGFAWPFAPLDPLARHTWFGQSPGDSIQFDHFVVRNAGAPVAAVLDTGKVSDHEPIQILIDTDDIKVQRAGR